MRPQHYSVWLIVFLFWAISVEAFACQVTPSRHNDADSSTPLERLTSLLDGGDQSRATLWQFAHLAREEHLRQPVLDRLAKEHQEDPDNVAIVEALYRALMAARQYQRAAEMAHKIHEAYCGRGNILRCSANDDAYLRAYALQLEFVAKASQISPSSRTSAAVLGLERTIQEAIVEADRVDKEYVLPASLEAALPVGPNHIAMDIRGSYAKTMLVAGRVDEAASIWTEALDLCPQFQDIDRCRAFAAGVEMELREAGRTFDASGYYRDDE